MTNEALELNIDYTVLWKANEIETNEIETEDKNDYVLIDNPINRIKDIKY